jgi:hypothetical protein
MIRERSFVRRGRRVHLRELTDWVALRPPQGKVPRTESDAGPTLPGRDLSATDLLDRAETEVPLSQIRAFGDAGWTFVPRASADGLDGNVRSAKVYIDPSGRLLLCADTLTVRFRDDISMKRADDFLKDYGCRVLEKLGLAPGLFRLALTEDARGDALDVAEELQQSPTIDFAEPEFIERLGAR